jgi:hypothetical protein
VGELREVAAAWDDLWMRSDVTSPISRAEPVALRVQHLAAANSFRGLIVEHDGRLVAALPLVNRRFKGMLNVGALPCNCWLAGGALLLDPATDSAAVLDCLMSAIAGLPWPALWLDQVSYDDPIWQQFRAAAQRAGLSVSVREHYQIGQIEIGHDWEAYKSRLKGDHRRKLNRYVRKLDEVGGAELKLYRDMSPDQVVDLTRQAFEIEDRSWKGTEGTSVLRNSRIFEQYLVEGQALTRLKHLEIAFLEQQGGRWRSCTDTLPREYSIPPSWDTTKSLRSSGRGSSSCYDCSNRFTPIRPGDYSISPDRSRHSIKCGPLVLIPLVPWSWPRRDYWVAGCSTLTQNGNHGRSGCKREFPLRWRVLGRQ